MKSGERNEQHETPDNQEEGADTKMQEAERSHVQKLTKIFQDSWEKNRKEGDPDVSFTFLFAAHAYVRDLHPKVRSELENADIYMPEVVGWRTEDTKDFDDISTGEVAPMGYSGSFLRAFEDAIEKTGVVVVIPDLPEGHQLIEQQDALDERLELIRRLPFDEAVQGFDQYTNDFAMVERTREEEIMKNIPVGIREALERNEGLQKRKQLKVVIEYGTSHTSLYHALSSTGLDVTRDMSDRPHTTYAHFEELHRKYLFGGADSKPTEELAARGLVAILLYDAIARGFRGFEASTDEELRVCRMAIDSLSVDDLRDVWGEHLRQPGPFALLAAVEKKGFVVPKTRAELDELLQSKRKS